MSSNGNGDFASSKVGVGLERADPPGHFANDQAGCVKGNVCNAGSNGAASLPAGPTASPTVKPGSGGAGSPTFQNPPGLHRLPHLENVIRFGQGSEDFIESLTAITCWPSHVPFPTLLSPKSVPPTQRIYGTPAHPDVRFSADYLMSVFRSLEKMDALARARLVFDTTDFKYKLAPAIPMPNKGEPFPSSLPTTGPSVSSSASTSVSFAPQRPAAFPTARPLGRASDSSMSDAAQVPFPTLDKGKPAKVLERHDSKKRARESASSSSSSSKAMNKQQVKAQKRSEEMQLDLDESSSESSESSDEEVSPSSSEDSRRKGKRLKKSKRGKKNHTGRRSKKDKRRRHKKKSRRSSTSSSESGVSRSSKEDFNSDDGGSDGPKGSIPYYLGKLYRPLLSAEPKDLDPKPKEETVRKLSFLPDVPALKNESAATKKDRLAKTLLTVKAKQTFGKNGKPKLEYQGFNDPKAVLAEVIALSTEERPLSTFAADEQIQGEIKKVHDDFVRKAADLTNHMTAMNFPRCSQELVNAACHDMIKDSLKDSAQLAPEVILKSVEHMMRTGVCPFRAAPPPLPSGGGEGKHPSKPKDRKKKDADRARHSSALKFDKNRDIYKRSSGDSKLCFDCVNRALASGKLGVDEAPGDTFWFPSWKALGEHKAKGKC